MLFELKAASSRFSLWREALGTTTKPRDFFLSAFSTGRNNYEYEPHIM